MPSNNFEDFLQYCIWLAKRDDDDDDESDDNNNNDDDGKSLAPSFLAPFSSLNRLSMASISPTTITLQTSQPPVDFDAAGAGAPDHRLQLLQRLRLRVKMNFEQRNKIFTAAKKFAEDGDDETALECFLFCLEGNG